MAIGRRSGFLPTAHTQAVPRSSDLFRVDPTTTVGRHHRVLNDPFAARNQLKEVPCCVSCAIVKSMEILDAVRGGAFQLSPMFHYYFARPGQSGWPWLTFQQGFATAVQRGICTEDVYPSRFSKTAYGSGTKNPNNYTSVANQFRIENYNPSTGEEGYYMLTRGDRVREWKSTLDQSWPIVIGIYQSEDYDRLDNDHSHPLASSLLPESGSPLTPARHATVVFGYNEDANGHGHFIVSDSRGLRFGDRGRWLLPFNLVNSGLVIEAWAVRYITYDV